MAPPSAARRELGAVAQSRLYAAERLAVLGGLDVLVEQRRQSVFLTPCAMPPTR